MEGQGSADEENLAARIGAWSGRGGGHVASSKYDKALALADILK